MDKCCTASDGTLSSDWCLTHQRSLLKCIIELNTELERMHMRQQELLKTCVDITRTTPYPEELDECRAHRAKLIAEVGTLRSENKHLRAEVESLRDKILPEFDRLRAELAEEREKVKSVRADLAYTRAIRPVSIDAGNPGEIQRLRRLEEDVTKRIIGSGHEAGCASRILSTLYCNCLARHLGGRAVGKETP